MWKISNGRLCRRCRKCCTFKTASNKDALKNEKYIGREDEYDFYFVDKQNHCVRVMDPYGRVTMYAGRPNGNADKGFNDGDLRKEARF